MCYRIEIFNRERYLLGCKERHPATEMRRDVARVKSDRPGEIGDRAGVVSDTQICVSTELKRFCIFRIELNGVIDVWKGLCVITIQAEGDPTTEIQYRLFTSERDGLVEVRDCTVIVGSLQKELPASPIGLDNAGLLGGGASNDRAATQDAGINDFCRVAV
jgi:hypothetical protein